jgi:hypothetical protein
MQWPALVDALARWMQQEQPDDSFTAATPVFVNNAELRCYRDLDLAASSGQNLSLSTIALSKTLSLVPMTGQTVNGTPVAYAYPVVVQGISARVGNRWVPYQLSSLDWLDYVWPDETAASPPSVGFAFYSMLDNQTARLAPIPDLVYPLRITGQWRPAPMTADNPQTWLWDNIPDLAFAAVMGEAIRYQRDFGPGAPDPQALPEWERTYNRCLMSAKAEEFVRKGLGPDFTPFQPAPMAHPQAPPQGA